MAIDQGLKSELQKKELSLSPEDLAAREAKRRESEFTRKKAQAEAEAVGEPRGGVGEHAGRVDGVHKLGDGGVAAGEYGVSVATAVRVDVGDRSCFFF